MSPNAKKSLFPPNFFVLTGMICLAVAMRLLVAFAPQIMPYNFTPVESVALFGGAYFTDRRWGFIVPLLAMFLADSVLGLHALIPVVYGCIALTVVLGFSLRDRMDGKRVLLLSLASASMFFIVTNFFVWLTSGMYALTTNGLLNCYIAAIPFFKWTLAGTLVWSAILFGGFELMRLRYPALQPAQAS